jgi:hypothetical protein
MGLEAEPVKQQDFRPYMAERTAKYQKTAGDRHRIVAAHCCRAFFGTLKPHRDGRCPVFSDIGCRA